MIIMVTEVSIIVSSPLYQAIDTGFIKYFS